MDKLKFYQTAALGMLLLNLGLLAFIVFAPPGAGANGPAGRANERLGLDEEQHAVFLESAEEHQAVMRKMSGRQREILLKYFQQLKEETTDVDATLPQAFTDLELQKIEATYQHLLSVKRLLRPRQMEKYPAFVDHALQRILLQHKKTLPSKKSS